MKAFFVFRLATLLLLLFPVLSHASEYQWSVAMPAPVQQGTNAITPHAYLWIPPECQQVRAVVIGQHNMLEEGIFDDEAFRRTLAELGFALIWITPSADHVFHFEAGASERFEKMLKELGAISGYTELADAPVVPLGHSAHASYPWNFAADNPDRTLAILSVKGDAPLTKMTGSGQPNPDWGTRTIDGIPALMVMGQFEWGDNRLDSAYLYRKNHPNAPIAFLADVGHGHFDYSPELIAQLSMFLRKAAATRLPDVSPLSGPVPLKPVDPKSGWLLEQWHPNAPRTALAAPFAQYQGDPSFAFWAFDKEQAHAMEAYHDQQGRKPQLLGFRNPDGSFVEQNTKSLEQLDIPFLPEADGVSFHTEAGFLNTVPAGNPTKWARLPTGSAIGHAAAGGPVMMKRIAGPFIATGQGSWELSFYRGDEAGVPKTSYDLWLVATHGGDATYASAAQQALIKVPSHQSGGMPHTITFPEIPDQSATAASVKLSATSSSGLPVHYYVRQGPAHIEKGNVLVFSPLPPRTRYPVKVTVVAWQYGRSSQPAIATADPIERSFNVIQ